MKTTKKILSVILAIIMIASFPTVVSAAQSFSGTYDEDITISAGASIADGTVFNGNVTIAKGATVENGTFKGAVTNYGTINGGTFKGAVTNNSAGVVITCGIYGGTFDGPVTNANAATIGGGTYNGSVTNNSSGSIFFSGINAGTFNGTVTNSSNSTIVSGVFNGVVNNNGTISGGFYYNLINNTNTVYTSVSAVVKNGDAYTVQGMPTLKGKISVSGRDATFTCNNTLYIADGGQLDLNCPSTINGNIVLSSGAKLTSNGGSLAEGSSGKITVPNDASFTGTSASKFDYITYREHSIKVESNIDANQFTFTVASSAYKDASVQYSFDLTGTIAGCLVLNNVTVYNGKKSDSNIIKKANDKVSSFTMPDNDVIIYVECTANHSAKSEHKDPTCTDPGYDKTYCDVCKHLLSDTKIDALGHQFGEWVRNTDSNSKMLKSRTCTRENCGYCEKSYIEIKGYDNQEVTVDFKSTLTFNYNVSAPEGCYVQWKKDKEAPVSANGNSFTVDKAEEDFEITAIVYGAVTDSYTVKVHVKRGFFDKLKAMFRGWFNALPVYVDNVKK